MRRVLAGCAGLLAMLFGGVPAWGDTPPGWDPERFLSLEAVERGMRGTGRTVLRGNVIETFEVEILGVLRTPDPEGEMILARLSGANLETLGIAAGMSGSPIFIDGKLIGALAFGWPFASEPITGITPIAHMLSMTAKAGGSVSGNAMGLPPEQWQALLEAPDAQALELLLPRGRSGTASLPPLQVPVAALGFQGTAADILEEALGSQGFVTVQGGALGVTDGTPGTLEAGSAIAVELLRGDAQLAAIGTVTWVEGNAVFAFGHPMLDRGATAYPMAHAEIVTVMPRLNSSFKMGAVGDPIGAISRDYRAGIVGQLGGSARMVPLTVNLTFPSRVASYHFEILDAEALTPAIAGLATLNSVQSAMQSSGAATQDVQVTVSFADGRTATTRSTLAGFSPPGELAGTVARVVGLIHGNPFQPVSIAGIAVEVAVREQIHAAFLEAMTVVTPRLHAGSPAAVEITLRDYRGERTLERMEMELPRTLDPGSYRIQVCDGERDDRTEQERVPGSFVPRDLDTLVRLLESEASPNRLVMRLIGPGANPVVQGRELPQLPGSAASLLKSSRSSARAAEAKGTVYAVRSVQFDKVILGCQAVPVTVAAPEGDQ